MIKKRFISMLVLLAAVVTGAWADTTVTWTASDMSGIYIDFLDGEAYNNTIKGITVTSSGGGGAGDGWEGTDINMDSGSTTITFTSSVGNIKSIAITAENIEMSSIPSGWTTDYSTLSWSGEASTTVPLPLSGWTEISGISEIVFTIESTVNVTGVTLAPTSATLTLGETETVTLIPTVLPNDATDKSVTWSSSNEAVATVTDGVVTAVGAGEATITVTTTDGAKTATCAVTVAAPAASTYTVTLKEGTEDATSWTIAPAEATTTGVAAGTEVKATYGGMKKVKSVKAVKKTQAAAYTMAAAATSADRGKLICADGHIHAYGEDADCTADRVAMITYVGSQTAETAYTHGLALALQDASEDMFTWSVSTASKHTFHPYPVQTGITTGPAESGLQYNATQNTASYPAFQAAIANNDVATPTDCSAWFLPSGYQWYQMFQALDSKSLNKGKNALRDSFESVGGANLKKGDYQTSTEYSKTEGVCCPFGSTVVFTSGSKTNGRYVRSCLAF